MKGVNDNLDAVLNSVKYKETNELAKGKINKLKTIKRMLYDRAPLELLKGRLFLSDYFHSIEQEPHMLSCFFLFFSLNPSSEVDGIANAFFNRL